MVKSGHRSASPKLGWALAAGGMLAVGLDSLFIRLADTDGWTMSFWVSLFGIPAFVVLSRITSQERLVDNLRTNRGPAALSILITAVTQISFVTAVTTAASVANVVAIIAASPIIAAVAARLFIGERTPLRVWGAAVGAGVGIGIVVSGSVGTPTVTGDALALLAVTGFALNTVLWRRYPGLNPTGVFLVSNVVICLWCLLVVNPFGAGTRVLVAAAAMGAVTNPLGRLLYSSAPRYIPAAEVALFSPVETVSAPIWVWIAFGERPSATTVVGGIVIVVSVIAGTAGSTAWTRRRRALQPNRSN